MRAISILGCVALASCTATATTDAGVDAGALADAAACTTDVECDDGVFCNGTSLCVSGRCELTRAACRGTQRCDETMQRCVAACAQSEDADGDGAAAVECGGIDCDDGDPRRAPGLPEVCDVLAHDEDCDPRTFGFRDGDGDGFPDARCCNAFAGAPRVCGTDCDDTRPGVNIAVPEVCNGLDDDCNGLVDEDLVRTYTVDADRDGHGSAAPGAPTMETCNPPPGFAPNADDCDDADPQRAPGLPELCDAATRDEDCSGAGNDVPGGCDCVGTMSRTCGTMGICAGATQQCMAGQWGPCSVAPRPETCDGTDENCDGRIDEGLRVTCYADADNDGYPAALAASMQCASATASRQGAPWNRCPVGFTGRAPGASATDCCDVDANARPGQTTPFDVATQCGGFDFDCDRMETSPAAELRMANCAYNDATSCGRAMTGVGWHAAPPACGASTVYSTFCTWVGNACYRTSTQRKRACF